MRENKALELKSTVSKTFLKTVSAYANFGTGKIMFGYNDDGTVAGLTDPQDTCLAIENQINDTLDPRPEFTLDIDDENKTVTLTVMEGYDKPYLYSGKAYRRSDTATIEVDKLELRRLVLEGQNLDFDELTCANEKLTFSYLQEKLRQHLGIIDFSEDMLRTLGLLNPRGFNNAAAILADENSFPGIDMAQFGIDENIILDREMISRVSALKQFDTAMDFYERHCCYERVADSLRKTIETIPRVAFREAIANALAHRTWDVPSPIKLSLHSDRIEVLSPGGLMPGMTVDSYLNGRFSMLRNPLIAEVFFRLGMIEKFGTGIDRIKRAYAETGAAPTFEVGESFIRVSLPILSDEIGLSDDESLILSLVPRYRLVPRADIDMASRFEKTKTVRILNSLIKKGLIKAEGEGRARKYVRLK